MFIFPRIGFTFNSPAMKVMNWKNGYIWEMVWGVFKNSAASNFRF